MAAARRNPPSEQLYGRRWPIFGVAMIGLFMALLDLTIVNIAIPEIERDLGTDVETVSWIVTAYNLVFAVLLVSMGRLADQFGRRRLFLIGTAIFTTGSLLCAVSGSIETLVGFRVVQAVGAAILSPLALAIVTLVFPPGERGRGLAMIAVVANAAVALGPPIGGVLLEYLSWHSIFAINVPLGIAAAVLASRLMPESYDLGATQRIDWLGALLIGGAIFALTFGLVGFDRQATEGSQVSVPMLAISLLLLVAFAASQRWGRASMLPRSLVANRQFIGATGTMLAFAVGYMGLPFLAVLGLVYLWGFSELEAAIALAPVSVVGAAMAPFVARIADRVPPRMIALPSLLVLAAGLAWLGSFPADADYLAVLPAIVAVGIGAGGTFPAVSIGAMGAIPGQELGLGSGIFSTARQVGFAVGVALLVAILAGVSQTRMAEARETAESLVARAGYQSERSEELLRRTFLGPGEGSLPGPTRGAETEREVVRLARDAARDGFGAGFRAAALAVLIAAPLALTMGRPPARSWELSASAEPTVSGGERTAR